MTKAIVLPSSGSRWQRFINWLAGGPPNREKLDKLKGKSWFVRHNISLVMLVGSVAILLAPEIVDRLNRVPDPATLQTVQARIIRTHLTEPHLFVELSDGSQRGMEWPVPISGGRGGFRSYLWTDDERERLPGCLATVRGVPLHWTINDRFRVWERECPERGIQIDLARTAQGYVLPGYFEIFLFVCLAGFYFFIFVIFLREKRGNP